MSKQKKRVFKRSSEQIHDLYKLEVAKAIKPATEYAMSQEIEHVHFYHTIDSKGVPQNTSISVSGHFHVLEVVTPATDTDPAVFKCSSPMVWVRTKTGPGRWEKKLHAANKVDFHVHEITYKDSQKWTPAKINPEYLKLQQMESQKVPTAVDGIAEG